MNRQKIFFDHMAKTGGSTVYNVLKAGLGEDAVTSQLILSHRELLTRYRWKTLISAHTQFHYGDSFDPERYYCTLLREPLDRALSNYWFARGMDSCANWIGSEQLRLAKSHGFDALILSEDPALCGWLSNAQAKHYAELTLAPSHEPSEEALYNAAKEALDRFDLVGINGEIEDFMLIVSSDCAVHVSGEIPFFNVTRQRRRLDELDVSVKARLDRLNAVDTELFHYARQLFGKQRRQRLRQSTRVLGQGGAGGVARGAEPAAIATPVQARNFGGQVAVIDAISIHGGMSGAGALYSGDIAAVSIQFVSRQDLPGAVLRMAIHDDSGLELFGVGSDMLGCIPAIDAGQVYQACFDFRNDLAPGTYFLSASLSDAAGELLHCRECALSFEVAFVSGFHFTGMVNLNPRLHITCGGAACIQGEAVRSVGLQRHGAINSDLVEFAADLHALAEPGAVRPGELFSLAVDVANRSRETWVTVGSKPIQLGYRWFDGDGGMLAIEGLRTRLPRDICPGESLTVFVHVQSPMEAGSYRLRICPVQEYVAWFDDRGGGYLDISLDVARADA